LISQAIFTIDKNRNGEDKALETFDSCVLSIREHKDDEESCGD